MLESLALLPKVALPVNLTLYDGEIVLLLLHVICVKPTLPAESVGSSADTGLTTFIKSHNCTQNAQIVAHCR